MIDPAVAGTTGILKSALEHGSSVRRIVVTSSCATIRDVATEPRVYSEADWNESAVPKVQAVGRAATQMEKYYASKILAERALWKFVEEHKDAHFDVVTLCPPRVFGLPVVVPDNQDALGFSNRYWIAKVLAANDMVDGYVI